MIVIQLKYPIGTEFGNNQLPSDIIQTCFKTKVKLAPIYDASFKFYFPTLLEVYPQQNLKQVFCTFPSIKNSIIQVILSDISQEVLLHRNTLYCVKIRLELSVTIE